MFRWARWLAFYVAGHATVFVKHLARIAIGLAHAATGEGKQGDQCQVFHDELLGSYRDASVVVP